MWTSPNDRWSALIEHSLAIPYHSNPIPRPLPASTMTEPASPDDNVETIQLDQFLKMAQIVQSGGEAKVLIQSGVVTVNGIPETRRGRKLRPGDTVTVDGEEFVIESDDD